MQGLAQADVKDRLIQAIFDVLDELESGPQWTTMTTQHEAEVLADAVFQVITETNDEDIGINEAYDNLGESDVVEET